MKDTTGREGDWKLAAGIILGVQLLIEGITMGILIWLAILPVLYMVLAGVVLLLIPIIEFLLFYFGKKHLYIRRVIGCVLSACLIVCCILASSMMAKAGNTMRKISKTIVTDTVSTYVLADDPAETLADASGYLFAITENYDVEHTQTAIDKINETIGTTIRTQSYSDMFAMVQALYDHEVGAVIMNAAYVDVIESVEGFEDFSEQTKTLFDHEIETDAADNRNTETGTADEARDITKDPFVLYISGSDTRTFTLATSRSDVNILVVVNPTTKQVLLINTPRDYYVEISIASGSRDKLTHCGIYGIDCSMDTLGNLYDETVDYYAQINFSGFQTLVDAIGGITVESEKGFYCSEGGYYISKGTNYLNGTVALSYVRERKAFSDGDLARGRHQMQAIRAIIDKVSSGTTVLTNYSAILDSMEGMFATNMTSEEMASLVRMQLTDMASWDVKTFSVSGTGSSQTTYSMPTKRSYVMYPDEAQVSYASSLVDKVMAGQRLTDADMEMPETTTTE
jgi:LCP family protein required for cell wall assembly